MFFFFYISLLLINIKKKLYILIGGRWAFVASFILENQLVGPRQLLSRVRVWDSIPFRVAPAVKSQKHPSSLSLSHKTQSVARKHFIKQDKRVFEKLFQIPNRSLRFLTLMETSQSQTKDRRPDALGDLLVLPDELLSSILERLTPRDVGRLSCVSR